MVRDEAASVVTLAGEIGADFAIGDPENTGRGLGTA